MYARVQNVQKKANPYWERLKDAYKGDEEAVRALVMDFYRRRLAGEDTRKICEDWGVRDKDLVGLLSRPEARVVETEIYAQFLRAAATDYVRLVTKANQVLEQALDAGVKGEALAAALAAAKMVYDRVWPVGAGSKGISEQDTSGGRVEIVVAEPSREPPQIEGEVISGGVGMVGIVEEEPGADGQTD